MLEHIGGMFGTLNWTFRIYFGTFRIKSWVIVGAVSLIAFLGGIKR